MQGLIVISVVVSYELVRRYGVRRQQQKVGEELAAGHAIKTEKAASLAPPAKPSPPAPPR